MAKGGQRFGDPGLGGPGEGDDAARDGRREQAPELPWVAELARRVASREPVVLATVTGVDGSASARTGSKALFDASGRLVTGWVGGGCAETSVRDAALECLRTGKPTRLRLDLDDEVLGVGMPCGGFMDLFVEPILVQPRLFVIGHGPIAEALARMGKGLDFHVTVHDALATAARFPTADVRIADDPEYAKVNCDAHTYVVITTQHKSDYEALSRVLGDAPAYVSLVASRKRSALLLERLHEDGVALGVLRRVAAPAGLDIGAVTPQEIALSILAEVVRLRRGGEASGRPLAEVRGAQLLSGPGAEASAATSDAAGSGPVEGSS